MAVSERLSNGGAGQEPVALAAFRKHKICRLRGGENIFGQGFFFTDQNKMGEKKGIKRLHSPQEPAAVS
jgi:hypothetical protein